MVQEENVSQAMQSQEVRTPPRAKPAGDSELLLAANLAMRFFMGATVIFVLAMTLTNIRHHTFAWADLWSGFILIGITILLSAILGKLYARQ